MATTSNGKFITIFGRATSGGVWQGTACCTQLINAIINLREIITLRYNRHINSVACYTCLLDMHSSLDICVYVYKERERESEREKERMRERKGEEGSYEDE